MTVGNKAFKGLAVPLWGESEIAQVTAATDILTMTAITAATADFLVCRSAGGGELFVVDDEGNLEKRIEGLAGLTIDGAAGNYLRFSNMPTTAPTTSLTKGDFFICAGSTNMSLALCIDSTQNTLRYFVPNTVTFGRDTLA